MTASTIHVLLGIFLELVVLLHVPHVQCVTVGLTQTEIQIFRDNGVDVTHKDSATWTVSHHGVPEHGFPGGWGNNPNSATMQNYTFDVPKNTSVAEVKGCVRLGPIGMSISGAPFYNPYTGEGHDAVDGDCIETFDDCSGHAGAQGAYHYHKLPACLYTGNTTQDLQNKFLGVAFDGYPIYGPMDETGKNWTSNELDRCHGHMHNGRYIYRITTDFPYILGCYHGNTASTQQPNGPPGGAPQSGGMRPPPRPTGTVGGGEGGRQLPTECQVKYDNWKMETCYAFCRSPSSGSYDNCPAGQQQGAGDGDDDTSAGAVINVSPFVITVLICNLMFY